MTGGPSPSTRPSIAARLGLSLFAAALLSLVGCATKDAVFVTKTSFSILEVDATPAGVSVAHDRTEGYFGPRFDDGHVYPVTGYFRGSGKGPEREVQQVFAGGLAATVVLGADPGTSNFANCNDGRDRPPLVFATSTTLGVKLGFLENTVLPTSFVFGYRRKEAAWVPVSSTCQPSVLATFDSSATAKAKDGESKLNAGVSQYFATGSAAVKLAQDGDIRASFRKEAVKAMGEVTAFNDRRANQNQIALEIIDCASRVPDAKFDSVVSNADEVGVLPTSFDAADIRKGGNAKEQLAIYARKLHLRNGDEDPRTAALTIHKTKVCKLANTS
jgi:hypothetical protein